MSEQTEESRSRFRLAAIVATVALSLMVTAFLGWSITCPCDRTPGGLLFGEQIDEDVADWSFANDVSLCQIQVSNGLMPYSINLNCMALG